MSDEEEEFDEENETTLAEDFLADLEELESDKEDEGGAAGDDLDDLEDGLAADLAPDVRAARGQPAAG